MVDVTLRQAVWEEEPQVAWLVKHCGPYVRDYFGIRDLRKQYDEGNVWVAVEPGGRLLAFAVARPLKREHTTVIDELATAPECRGEGIGTALMKRAARGRPIRLVVAEQNETAVAYYAKRGLVLKYPRPVPTRSGKKLVWRMEGQL